MKKEYTAFYLFVASIFLLIVAPSLLSDGMFMDGLMYAAISNDIANGKAEVWNLVIAHPPLAFAIQSVFFDIFGDNLLVERFYSIGAFILTAYIIILLWKEFTDKIYHKFAWLPLLFWTLIPLVTWSASNNMLENTMMIFVNLSILFILRSINKNRVLYLIIAGFMLFLGVITKGLVALFPLALPFWIYAMGQNKSFKRFFEDSSLILVGIVVPFALLFGIVPESFTYLEAYYNKQLVYSLSSSKTVDTRFFIFFKLLLEALIPIIICIIVFLFTRNKIDIKIKAKWTYILLAMVLSGVLPIMVSMKQSGFYMVPVFPIVSIFLAYLIIPSVKYLVDKINFKSDGFIVFKYLSVALFIVSLSLNFSSINTIGRDKERLEDIYLILDTIDEVDEISLEPALRSQWCLHGYFQRYGSIHLDHNEPPNDKYLLMDKNSKKEISEDYKLIELDLKLFKLLEKKRCE